MKTLTLIRFGFFEDCTVGLLKDDGKPRWFTLEDPDRTMFGFDKIPGKTAIPAGTYGVRIKPWSPKFKRAVPEIVDVPDFTDILMHIGNRAKDTRGCVLTGMRCGVRVIYDSAVAFEQVFQAIKEAGGAELSVIRGSISHGESSYLSKIWKAERWGVA